MHLSAFVSKLIIDLLSLSSYCLIHTRDSELRKVLEAKNKKKKRKLSGQQDEHARPPTSKPNPGRPGVRTYTKRPKVIDLGSVFNSKVINHRHMPFILFYITQKWWQ
jgi:hypothetical protein